MPHSQDAAEGKLTALVRAPSATLADCELSFLERASIDVVRARSQHAEYVRALREAGAHVVELPRQDEMPDAAFVEDTVVVLDELAALAPKATKTRDRETASVAAVLAQYRELKWLELPAVLDGGDVLRLGRDLFVGRSARTNDAAIEQLRSLIGPLGYTVTSVPVTKCLHLKTACSAVGPRTVLADPDSIDVHAFADGAYEVIAVDPAEPWAANALWVGDTVLLPARSPRTRSRVAAAGRRLIEVDIGELQKAEAGLTCMSILVPHA